MSPSSWPAPGKLNLFLHIVGRRADGYHLLQTVFQFIDWGDELWFTPRADGAIRLLTPLPQVPPEQDLTVRAATLLQTVTATPQGVDIRVLKRLPLGGGLGGGSSDAATTLVALNQVWGLHQPTTQLAEWGLQLGADVPVFVHGHAAWAEGVGEHLSPISPPESHYVVLHPGVTVSTAQIFSAPDLTRARPAATISGLSGAAFVGGEFVNVCEPIVRARYPAVGAALDWLGMFGAARMTGTGACVFVSVADEATAQEIVARVPAAWRAWAVRGLNRSPLATRVTEG